MLDPNTIAIGERYRNIKTGNIYEVVLISQHSENPLEFLVSYTKDGDELPWSRPLSIFVTKFEEVEYVSA